MLSPQEVLEGTDWDHLVHAYAVASDTPIRLAQLLDASPRVRSLALAQLDMSVLNQDTLYPATAPAALFIAGILSDSRTDVLDGEGRPMRASLIEWLGRVDEADTYGEAEGKLLEDDEERESVMGCRAIRADLGEAIRPFLDSPDEEIRKVAGVVCANLAARG